MHAPFAAEVQREDGRIQGLSGKIGEYKADAVCGNAVLVLQEAPR